MVTEVGADAFLGPLPVERLWGVGPATLDKLHRIGVRRVLDLVRVDESVLATSLGASQARHLAALARGIDDRPVEPEREAKSIGHEETFAVDLHRREDLDRELVRLADGVAMRLRASGVAARTVVLKVRDADFRTVTRSTTVADPVDSGRVLWRTARGLLDELGPLPGVRLLGISGTGLVVSAGHQLRLDDAADSWSEADGAVDRIRDRFGMGAITPATAVGDARPPVKERGDQPWGPQEGA